MVVGFYALAKWNDKASRVPFVRAPAPQPLRPARDQLQRVVRKRGIPSTHARSLQAPKEFPYDNLRVELARKA